MKEIRCERERTGVIDCATAASGSAAPSAAVLDADSATNPTRPDGLGSGSAGESEASADEVAPDVPCTGAGTRCLRNIVSSQVGNGAVNGESVRMISQAALTVLNIDVPAASAR